MPDLWVSELKRQLEADHGKEQNERRAQPRSQTVFSRIEDATYAILRQHEKKSA
jgi:hypothetical protein